MIFSKLRCLILFLSLLIAVSTLPGCDSSPGGSSGNNPSPPPTDLDRLAICGWSFDAQKLFTQQVNAGHLGGELMFGSWEDRWDVMVRFDEGGAQYIMAYMSDCGDWFILTSNV